MSAHPMIHYVNASFALPVVALMTGHFPVIIGTLAALAAFILYTMQIADWLEQRREKRARAEAAKILDAARAEAATLLAVAQTKAAELTEAHKLLAAAADTAKAAVEADKPKSA